MPPRKRASVASARLHWEGRTEPELVPAVLQPIQRVLPAGARRLFPEPLNRLYYGDNLPLLWALLPELEGKANLIYADPPFLSGKHYPARIGRDEDSRRPKEWLLDDGYNDQWPLGEAYLDMLYPRLKLMHRLLAPDGTLYLHLDWRANHYARLLLDEIFGPDHLLNEIVWVYHGPSPIRSAFSRKHDTILAYRKSDEYVFNSDQVRTAYYPSTVKTFASSPRAGFGKVPDLDRGKIPEDWWYFPVVARLHSERTGYPTQKPEALLERIIKASSRPGDLVVDLFCGAGTVPVVSERVGRQWLAADASGRAIHTTLKRLVAARAQPFEVVQVTQVGAPATFRPSQRVRVSAHLEGLTVTIGLEDFRLPGGRPFPEDVDYWEVDFEHDGQLFQSTHQQYRAGAKAPLPLSATHAYTQPGTYRVLAKAVSIYGIPAWTSKEVTVGN